MFRTPSKTDQAKDAVAAGADKAAELKVKAGEAATATAAGAVAASSTTPRGGRPPGAA